MATLNDLTTVLNGLNQQLLKAKDEIVAKITALEELIGSTALPPEVAQKLEEIKAVAQALDDITPDV